MTSITGVNLRRLGLHITTPLRVRTTTGRKEAPLEATAPVGGLWESTVRLHLLFHNVILDHLEWHLQLRTM